MGTLQAIAKKLDVSPSTVSRALRNLEGVNQDTRRRVQRVARDLNYRRHSSQAVGVAVILPGKSIQDVHELAQRYMLAVSNAIAERGWSMFPVVIDPLKRECLETMASWPATLRADHLNGCIVIDRISLQSRKTLREHFGDNVVMLSRHDAEHGISGICSLDYDGGKMAARKVLDAGHRRIGWIGSIGSLDVAHERRSGFLSSLERQGARVVCEAWMDERHPLSEQNVHNAMNEQLPEDRSAWPTAWVSSNDWLAAKAIVYFKSLGLSVPGDVSLVAFDDTVLAETLAGCVISSVVMPFERMAERGVDLLERLISRQEEAPVIWSYLFNFREGQTLASL